MPNTVPLPLSILDLVPITSGSTVGEAVAIERSTRPGGVVCFSQERVEAWRQTAAVTERPAARPENRQPPRNVPSSER